MQAYIEFSDSCHFDQGQITDVPEPVPVHLWLDHTITDDDGLICALEILLYYCIQNLVNVPFLSAVQQSGTLSQVKSN